MSLTLEYAAAFLEYYSPKVADNITNQNGLLFYMKEKGRMKKLPGGDDIREAITFQGTGTGKWYTGLETLDTSQQQVLIESVWDWKNANVNVVISGEERRKNASAKYRKHELLKTRTEAASAEMSNLVASSQFSDGTGSGGKEITGLEAIIADDPTTGTVGNLNSATYSWWRNVVYDFSSEGYTGSEITSSVFLAAMDSVDVDTQHGNQRCDLIVMGKNFYNKYRAACEATKRITVPASAQAKILGDAGFNALEFSGIPVLYDANAGDNVAYFLNTNFLNFNVHKDANFVLEKERMAYNQDGMVFPMLFMGNFSCSGRKYLGKMIL